MSKYDDAVYAAASRVGRLKFPSNGMPEKIVDRFWIWLINLISWPIAILVWFKRNPKVVRIILGLALTSAGLGMLVSWELVLFMWSWIIRIVAMMAMMVVQIVALFWFLSSTKNTVIRPGDDAVVNFDDDYFGQENLVSAVRQWTGMMTPEGQELLQELGAESLSGMLLIGPPGTGKTHLAQCLAGEGKISFIGMNGSDFAAMFIGVGPMKVKKVEADANRYASEDGACIVFIDEIDSVAASRGGVEGEQPLDTLESMWKEVHPLIMGGGMGGAGLGVSSKLLSAMDGTKKVPIRAQIRNKMHRLVGLPEITPGVVLWMGATNRPAVLDPAFVRPGRLDKKLRVDPPDDVSRRAIVEGYLGKVKHADDVDVDQLVLDTQGVTPADLESAIRRSAARYTLQDMRPAISMRDIEQALQEDLVGIANPIENWEPEQKRQVAVHEAGHALISYLTMPERRVTNISVTRRGSGTLGYMRDVEQKEVFARPLAYFENKFKVAIAGHIATHFVLGEDWTGAEADFRHARYYLRRLAAFAKWGLPFTDGDPLENSYIAERANAWYQEATGEVYELLEENRGLLESLWLALVERDELNSEEFYELVAIQEVQ